MNFALRGVAAAGLAATLAAPVAADTLRFASFTPENHAVTPSVVEPLMAAIEGSGLEIRTFPGGELGPGPVEQYIRAVNGVADLSWGLQGYTSSQFPMSMLIELPGVSQEAGTGADGIWRAYDDYLASEYPATVPLALWISEPNVLIMRDREVRSPADLEGLTIRVSGAVPGRVIEALGATPLQMPATEMYNALQTGLIDGIMTGASAIRDFRLDEVADIYVEGPALGNIMFFLVMNRDVFDSLPEGERAALEGIMGLELSRSGETGWNSIAADTMDALRADPDETVITLTEDEIAAFDELTLAVRDSYVAELDAEGLPASAVIAAMTGAE